MKKKILIGLVAVIASIAISGCAHNLGGNFTGIIISQGGFVFGSGTFAITKGNADQNYSAGTDSRKMKYSYKIGSQTSGYDVEMAKVTADSTKVKK